MVKNVSMAIRMSPDEIVGLYKKIEQNVMAESSNFSNAWEVERALARIFAAVVVKYDLKKTFDIHRRVQACFNVIIEKINADQATRLSLSTAEEMLNAKIQVHEDAEVLQEYMGEDSGRNPRGAGFYTQLSLQRVLKDQGIRYAELEAIANTTPQIAKNLYEEIAVAARVQYDRLIASSHHCDLRKAQKIEKALNRLGQAVLQKYQLSELDDQTSFSSELKEKDVKRLKLYSTEKMMKAKIPKKDEPGKCCESSKPSISLEEALNIASNNIFNAVSGDLGPLWGESRALTLTRLALTY